MRLCDTRLHNLWSGLNLSLGTSIGEGLVPRLVLCMYAYMACLHIFELPIENCLECKPCPLKVYTVSLICHVVENKPAQSHIPYL